MEHREEMPLGFGFQLAMNENAMDKFAKMAEAEKKQILDAAKNVSTKEQMRGIVEDIAKLS